MAVSIGNASLGAGGRGRGAVRRGHGFAITGAAAGGGGGGGGALPEGPGPPANLRHHGHREPPELHL